MDSLIGNGQAAVTFLPTKPITTSIGSLNVTSGFVVTEFSGTDYLQFAYVDSSGQVQLSASQTFPLSGADPNYPLYEFDVTTTTTQASIIVFNYNPTTIASSQYEQLVAPLPFGPMAFPSYQSQGFALLANNINNGYTPIGGSLAPAPPPAQDFYSVLLSNGAGAFTQGGAQVNDVTGIFPSTTGQALLAINAALAPILGTVSRSLYYQNQTTGASFASFFSGGTMGVLAIEHCHPHDRHHSPRRRHPHNGRSVVHGRRHPAVI